MRFGICAGVKTDYVQVMKACGYDYFETNMTEITAMSEEEFASFHGFVEKCGLPCEASNCFIPGQYKLTGADIDYGAISAYVAKALKRASALGLKTAVFGSGGARRYPESTNRQDAQQQITFFLKEIVSPEASKYSIQIAIEPLNKSEDNAINSVPEGVRIAKATGCDNIKTLADLYHVYLENDPLDAISRMKGDILHSHIANPVRRKYPQPGDGFDFLPFLNAIESAGCPRCSVEAGTDDFIAEAPKALELLRSLPV